MKISQERYFERFLTDPTSPDLYNLHNKIMIGKHSLAGLTAEYQTLEKLKATAAINANQQRMDLLNEVISKQREPINANQIRLNALFSVKVKSKYIKDCYEHFQKQWEDYKLQEIAGKDIEMEAKREIKLAPISLLKPTPLFFSVGSKMRTPVPSNHRAKVNQPMVASKSQSLAAQYDKNASDRKLLIAKKRYA